MKSTKNQRSNKAKMASLMPPNGSVDSTILNANSFSNFSIQFTNLNSYDTKMNKEKTNLNPKFLNSMIRLIDKYHISYNILCHNTKANMKPPFKKNDHKKVREPKQNDEKPKKSSHAKFSEEEDNILKNTVEMFGAKNWRFVALMIQNKTARQCRDRYMNYLVPGFSNSVWTEEEDRLLSEKFNEIGPHWSLIQQFFPNRTANSIKNRFKCTLSKNQNLMKSQSTTAIVSNQNQSMNMDENNNFQFSENFLNDLDEFNFDQDFYNDSFEADLN